MSLLGAHQSIAGGCYRAVERASAASCDCVQLFTKNSSQWRNSPLDAADGERFRQAMAATGVRHPLAHSSYLINLATSDETLWKRSVAAFVAELRRCDLLGIPYLVLHPGSYTSGNEASGIRQIAAALDAVASETSGVRAQCLLETTAGQGTSIGWRFEHLAAIFDMVRTEERLGGVCLDTSHLFAAGYAFDTPRRYRAMMRSFDRLVGLERVKAIHLNDSKRELGARVDRHQHIGRGAMGLEPFRLLLNDEAFRAVPMYLETPKGEENGVDLDLINLRTLRDLAG